MLARAGEFAFGRGAGQAEVALSVGAGTVAAGVAVLCVFHGGIQPVWWQWILLLVIAFDIGGGIPANATAAAAREHHRSRWRPLWFASGHLHPLLAWQFLPGYSLEAGIALYGLAVAGVLLVILTAPGLKRAVSLSWTAAAVVLGLLVTPTGWQWLAPMFLVKLVASHAVPQADAA